MFYARIGDAYRAGDAGLFEKLSGELRHLLSGSEPQAAHRAGYEYSFNQFQPFYRSMGLYVLATLWPVDHGSGAAGPLSRVGLLVAGAGARRAYLRIGFPNVSARSARR